MLLSDQILFIDADAIVIDKPAGMAAHPAPGSETGTLVNALIGGEVHRRMCLSDPGIDDYRNELLWCPERPTLITADIELLADHDRRSISSPRVSASISCSIRAPSKNSTSSSRIAAAISGSASPGPRR